MTTVAYHQYANIPFAGGSYASAPVIGPLDNPNTPACAILFNHTLGVLPGPRSNPPQFYPANNASDFSQARHYYARTAISVKRQAEQTLLAKSSPTSNRFSMSSQRQYPVSTHMNYIVPPASSQYTSILKSRAVGKSAYNPGRGPTYEVSYKAYDKNDVKIALRTVRSGGCTAPKKKGSIYNSTLCSGKACPWGGIVRTYQAPQYPLFTAGPMPLTYADAAPRV